MAVKKKKKAVKRTATKSKPASRTKLYGMDQDFVIISGGGLVIILLALYFIYR